MVNISYVCIADEGIIKQITTKLCQKENASWGEWFWNKVYKYAYVNSAALRKNHSTC